MAIIKIKPLSVNQAWQGKRFKTKGYLFYEQYCMSVLPAMVIPEGNLQVNLELGLSNKANDIDNSVKPFLDIMQKKYKFDDKMIYEMNLKKTIVKKGEEFIKFNVYSIPLNK